MLLQLAVDWNQLMWIGRLLPAAMKALMAKLAKDGELVRGGAMYAGLTHPRFVLHCL
jgi:hypothetical protein